MSWDVSWSVLGPGPGSHSHTGTWSHFKMNTLVINHLKHNSANSMKIADCPPSMGNYCPRAPWLLLPQIM